MDFNESIASQVTRHARLMASLEANQLQALVLNPGPSLLYLTGLHFHLSERPVVACFMPDIQPAIVLPEMEAGKAAACQLPLQIFPYEEDPHTWIRAFRQAAQALKLPPHCQIGIESRSLRVLELRLLEEAMADARFVDAGLLLESLRMLKDHSEIMAMRKAVEVAQAALQASLPHVRLNMSESELASELTFQLLRLGSDPELAFSPIVATGPNSANPHARPGDRPLQPGELLLLDWGARVSGYVSDLTRTFALGEINPEIAHISRITAEANAAGRAAARPGALASEVDRAARAVIEEAGFGPQFTHRTGHGIGLDSHEAPYIRAGNPMPLEPGMTFTIEPGIYLPGRGGVRIEDNLLITADGNECLTSLDRSLLLVT